MGLGLSVTQPQPAATCWGLDAMVKLFDRLQLPWTIDSVVVSPTEAEANATAAMAQAASDAATATAEPTAPPKKRRRKVRVRTRLVHKRDRRILRLTGDEIAAETVYGFHLVVPAWNVDVAIGIVRDGVIEPWTNAVFLSLFGAGDHVVNVGANFGYYAALAAQRVGGEGRVYAVEANPVVFSYLLKGMFWSGSPGIVRAHNCAAVSPDKHGEKLTFCYDPQFIGGGNLFSRARVKRDLTECLWSETTMPEVLDEERKFIPRGLFREVETEGRTLDSFVDQPVKAMLIDAEGSESYVIGGAHKVISQSPDISLIVEWDPHSYRHHEHLRPHIDSMWNFLLDEQGFQVFRICPEDYPGFGHMPKLEPVTSREQIFNLPHSDLLMKRA
jgi:FkbM family methyltransferase